MFCVLGCGDGIMVESECECVCLGFNAAREAITEDFDVWVCVHE